MTSLFPARPNGHKARISPLPSYANTFSEKPSLRTRPNHWTTTYHFHIPGSRRGRRLRIVVPLPRNIYHSAVHRWGQKRILVLLLGACFFVLWTLLSLKKRPPPNPWPMTPPSTGEESSLVFAREDLQRVWEWEIASGHYPSSRKSAFSRY